MNVKPRNSFVVIKIVDTGFVGSVMTPQKSIEGKEYFVEAVGPKVEDLQPGDRVHCIGNSQSVMFLPGSKDHFFTHEENVILVYPRELH